MAQNQGKAGKGEGNVIVPQKRPRNLTSTVLMLAVGLVLVIILVLLLLQMRGRNDDGQQGGRPSPTLPSILNPDQQNIGAGQIMYLYFRLDDRQQLAAQAQQVMDSVDETAEEAAVRALIEGPQTSSAKLTRLLPADTKIVRAEGRGDTFYITFDRTLIRSQSVGETLPMENALRDRLRLIAQSITNTIVNIGNFGRVQILIDYEDSGFGSPPSSYEFGFAEETGAGDLPPLVYDQMVVCNAENSLNKLMNYVQNEDWQKIYTEFLRSDGQSLPAVQEFSEAMDALPYRLSEWELFARMADVPQGQAQFLVNLTFIYEDGRVDSREGVPLRLYENAGPWTVNYDALLRILNASEQQ